MPENSLPKVVCRLLDTHIFSVSQLETLLLLRRHAQRAWGAHQVANELHTNDVAALDMLSTLARSGLIVQAKKDAAGNPMFKYDDRNKDVDYVVTALAEEYQNKRMRVIDQIYKKPSGDRFNRMADAFKLRRDDQ